MTSTPGPWTYQTALNHNGFEVVEVPTTPAGYIFLEADARKMAAAPELLDALQETVDSETCDCCIKARAIIAKATGEVT